MDDEITCLVSIYDQSKKTSDKTPYTAYFLGVGWGLTPPPAEGMRNTSAEVAAGKSKTRRERGLPKLHIWQDPKPNDDEFLLC